MTMCSINVSGYNLEVGGSRVFRNDGIQVVVTYKTTKRNSTALERSGLTPPQSIYKIQDSFVPRSSVSTGFSWSLQQLHDFYLNFIRDHRNFGCIGQVCNLLTPAHVDLTAALNMVL